MIATSLTTVAHTLRVRHAVTKRPVPGLSATLVPPTPWWWGLRTTPNAVAVFTSDRYTGGPAPVVRLTVTDPLVALTLVAPVVEISLTTPAATHEFVPVAQTLTVDLVDRTTGAARSGRTVRAIPATGPAIALPEVAGQAGTYRTAARTWTAAELPFDLQVDTHPVDRFSLDPYRVDTRLHAVSPA